jgi:hypothetical protein
MLGVGAAVIVTGAVMNVLGKTRYEFRPGSPTSAVLEPGVLRF